MVTRTHQDLLKASLEAQEGFPGPSAPAGSLDPAITIGHTSDLNYDENHSNDSDMIVVIIHGFPTTPLHTTHILPTPASRFPPD